MLFSWKMAKPLTPEDFLISFAPTWKDAYEKDIGLRTGSKEKFINDVGLVYEYGQSYMPSAIREMLEKFGPIWFTVGNVFNTHANIVTAVTDTSYGNTYVTFIDPATGVEQEQIYGEFMRKYELPAYYFNEIYMEEMIEGTFNPIQVVHFPELGEYEKSQQFIFTKH